LSKQPGGFFKSWTIINSVGQAVASQRLTQNGIQNLNIDLNDLSQGIYMLKLETNKGTTVRRVIKIR